MRFHGAGRTDVVSRDYAQADGDLRVSLVAHFGGRVVAVAGFARWFVHRTPWVTVSAEREWLYERRRPARQPSP